MTTSTLITSALIGRARERSMSLGFAVAPVAHAHVCVMASNVDCAPAADSVTTVANVSTAAHAAVTSATVANLWLGGFQGAGFGSDAYGTKRIHPGRLEGMT